MEIRSWIAATSASDDDQDESPAPGWQRDKVQEEWEQAMEYAQWKLLNARTKERVEFLKEELLGFVVQQLDLTLSRVLDIFKLLTLTYPRYNDTQSQAAVEELGMALVKRDEVRGKPSTQAEHESKLGVAEQILGWMAVEVGRLAKRASPNSFAPSDLFVLLSWSCHLYSICTEDPQFISTRQWNGLIGILASLLDMLTASDAAKESLKHGGLVRVRRALRSAGEHLQTLIRSLLTLQQAEVNSTPLRTVPLIGVAVSVLIRLKMMKEPAEERLSEELKADIIKIYTTSVLLSKSAVPPHVLTFLHDFIATFAANDDFEGAILPSIEKALLRSPEHSLAVTTTFFQAYSQPLSQGSFKRVLTQAINTAKSSNATVRINTVQLFQAILSSQSKLRSPGGGSDPSSQHIDSLSQLAVTELLALPKSGKSAGPDHRAALYSMLGSLRRADKVSHMIIDGATSLLAKETSEAAVAVLAAALPLHISFLLKEDKKGLANETVALIGKEMANPKVAVKKAFCTLAGSVFFESDDDAGLQSSKEDVDGKLVEFAKSLIGPFDNGLKAVAANPINIGGGPLEGYVAAAVLMGPLSRSGKFDEIIQKNPVIQSITPSGLRTAFVLWDKVYQKVNQPEEEKWVLRALEGVFGFYKNELAENENMRIQLGSAIIYFGVEGSTPEIRKNVNLMLQKMASTSPTLINEVMYDALQAFLAKGVPTSATNPEDTSDGQSGWNKHVRVASLLSSVSTFGTEKDVGQLEPSEKEGIIVKLIVFAHHPVVCGTSRQLWIDLCQRAGTDPKRLVDGQIDKLLHFILKASFEYDKPGFPKASYNAITTLVFVSPAAVLPLILSQLQQDVNTAKLTSLSETDYAIWATPEGTTYVDVLASNKSETRPTKGKGAAIAKWEDDIRKSIANKKTAPVTLTKQQQALVQAQLEKEQVIRRKVANIQRQLERALEFVNALVSAGVEESRAFVSSLSHILLAGPLENGKLLVGRQAVEAYLELAKCTADRLDTFRRWTGIATLRSLQLGDIPEDLEAEPTNLLALRVLYRLRTLSEQTPFDPATFSYAYPLLSAVLRHGGISPTDEDEGLEQVALALDIIKFHSGDFSDSAFPRLQVSKDLIHIIQNQPKLSKNASSALIDLGEAIHGNTTKEEVDVLLKATLYQESHVRNSALQALQPIDLTDLDWSPELWIALHDDDDQNARLARHAWEDNGLDTPEGYLDHLIEYLGHEHAYVRASAAAAISEGMMIWTQTIEKTIAVLQEYYRDKAKILAPEFDEYGMIIAQSVDRADPWPARVATAKAFELAAPFFAETQLEPFFTFLISDEALGDRVAEVRRGMLTAGTTVIDLHGAKRLAGLISTFEKHLSTTSPPTESGDHIKEAVVILFGRVARHLDASDPRIPGIVDRLVEALQTPAEQVQIAVSDCLSPLIPLMRNQVGALVDKLFDQLFRSPKYAVRRGAAYGLAGVVKGTGISGFKEYNIMARLRSATDEKKQYEPRQGVMFAFETLSTTLGRLFEPYITYVLPLLLTCFGDATTDVRDATQDAARVLMGNMSGFGVKIILPTLLEGLDEKQWRTKKGSIELLGMMAYCSPRQLSLSLPIVIPRLTGVLTDSHAQVKAAANKSLKQFGEVITNPEIQSLVPVLLKALVDPGKTNNALSSLLKMSFMHYIDHSSLALVIPILERGLRERGAETKKKAAQIVGNLASLTDAKDFVPYLSSLLPMVHQVLVDPVPEARATAAKSLGTLVERLGELHFPDLVPGLLRTLKTDASAVDRQGAAQGLSEVLSGLGMERLEGLMPDIIANAQSPRPTVREGFMSLLVFLPATFGTRFQPHLPKIIPPILSGLSDTEEYVRETAMRAGRMVVTNYSTKAIDLLLPELEQGMFDPGWRIRQSSITLVGELLFKVSGISGKPSDLEEEEVAEATAVESSRRALGEVLGIDRRDRILAALYIVRQDGVVIVRQSSIQIWKALVNNTPRTVREILPAVVNQVVSLIAGEDIEQQETAGRTASELCRKFGERMLGEIVNLLKSKSTSSDARTREGVCLMILEIMQSATDGQREDYEDDIIAMVRTALVDDEANVRAAAAKAFDALQEQLGAKAIDQTIPTLLEALRQPGQASGTALQALQEVMSVRATTVFPVLIPTLTAYPMSIFNARALASLVTVAGNALSRRLTVILGSLVRVIEEDKDEELLLAVDEALRALLSSINDAEGLNTLMMILLGWAKSDAVKRRVSAYHFFGTFCESSELDSSLYRIDWVRQLISSFDDPEVSVHTAAWNAMDLFVRSLPKDELEPLVITLRRSIEVTGPAGVNVPGFCLPKGVTPLVPIIIAGLTTGSYDQREQAAFAIGDIVQRTDENSIKPYVVPFTGPLIRVATQATSYPPGVKIGILSALTSMLEKIPVFVKPFFPQLQRTFVKSASDPSGVPVRDKAAQALGALMKNQPRVDPVITELITGVKANEDAIASSLVHALANVVKMGSANVGEKAREACVELVAEAFREDHDDYYARAIGQLVSALSMHPELLRSIAKNHLVEGTPPTMLSSHVILAVLAEVSEDDGPREGPNLFQNLSVLRQIAQKVLASAASDRPAISRPARDARDILKAMDDEALRGLF